MCAARLLLHFNNNKKEPPCYPHLFTNVHFLPLCLCGALISGFYLSSLWGHKTRVYYSPGDEFSYLQITCRSCVGSMIADPA